MTKNSRARTWGGRREGAGGKSVDPALRAARNPRAHSAQQREASAAPLDPTAVFMARINDAPLPEGADELDEYDYHYCASQGHHQHKQFVALWMAQREEVLAGWIHSSPGTRPSTWWVLDAPRLTEIPPGYGAWVLRHAIHLRARVGGQGRPYNKVNTGSNAPFGIPSHWSPEGFDRNDPPTFESQASYLRRLGLLARGEALRLRPNDFKPVPLPQRFWPIGSKP